MEGEKTVAPFPETLTPFLTKDQNVGLPSQSSAA